MECYQRAANLFKMAKNWPQAGHAFCEAAELQAKAGSRHDAATNYVDAANCYKKTDINGGCFRIDVIVISIHICIVFNCRSGELFVESNRNLYGYGAIHYGGKTPSKYR